MFIHPPTKLTHRPLRPLQGPRAWTKDQGPGPSAQGTEPRTRIRDLCRKGPGSIVHGPGRPGPRAQSPGHRTKDQGPRAQSTEARTPPRAQDTGPRTQDPEPRTHGPGPSPGLQTQGPELRTQDPGPLYLSQLSHLKVYLLTHIPGRMVKGPRIAGPRTH